MERATFEKYFLIGAGIIFVIQGLRALSSGTATRKASRSDPRYREEYRQQVVDRDIEETHSGFRAKLIGAGEIAVGIFLVVLAFKLH